MISRGEMEMEDLQDSEVVAQDLALNGSPGETFRGLLNKSIGIRSKFFFLLF